MKLFFCKCSDEVVCNDLTLSRVKRIRKVASEYLYNTPGMNKFTVTHSDAVNFTKENYFNKVGQIFKKYIGIGGIHIYRQIFFSVQVLVDVPCTNDRISVTSDENNYFASNRTVERIRLPEKQTDLLAYVHRILIIFSLSANF